MIFEGLDRIKRDAVLNTIILMIMGIVLLIIPSSLLPFINDVLGFSLLVVAVLIILKFLTGNKALIQYIFLTLGLLLGLLGVSLWIFEQLLEYLLFWMVFGLPIIGGLYGIYHAVIFARRSSRKGWWILVVLSFMLIACGGFGFYNPLVSSSDGIMRIIGGTLMFTACINGLSLIWLWPIQNIK